MNLFNRILRNFSIRLNALNFGFSFVTLKSFQVPSSININEKKVDLKFPVDTGMRDAFQEIFLVDGYRLRYLKDNFKINSIVDIGGNVGLFSLAARGYFPEAIIHSYEPNPFLKEFITSNLITVNIEIFPFAVGLFDATIPFYISEQSLNV